MRAGLLALALILPPGAEGAAPGVLAPAGCWRWAGYWVSLSPDGAWMAAGGPEFLGEHWAGRWELWGGTLHVEERLVGGRGQARHALAWPDPDFRRAAGCYPPP